jgi:beta-galactosidase beta subunit
MEDNCQILREECKKAIDEWMQKVQLIAEIKERNTKDGRIFISNSEDMQKFTKAIEDAKIASKKFHEASARFVDCQIAFYSKK